MKTSLLPTAPPGGRMSLSCSFSPPNLENKLLSQTSSFLKPQTSSTALTLSPQCLQLSSLTSTTSTLLSSPYSSSLLSTKNKLLDSGSVPKPCTVSRSVRESALLNRFVQSADLKETQDRDTDSAMICCAGEDTTVHCSEEDEDMSEECSMFEEEEGSSSAIFDSPVQDLEKPEEPEMKQEEFEEVKREKQDKEEELKNKKYLLLNMVCCSLVNKSKSPGQEEWDSENSVWTKIKNLSKDISEHDPEFLLKVAVYTRQELNIRITANFLLALAANLSSTKSHVRRYFCAAVQLPSDWLEVVRIYNTCFSRSLPYCLKRALTDKFKQFSEFQLAKYNTRKHRCKHNCKKSKKSKGKEPSEKQLKRWADLVRSEPAMIKKLCMGDPKKKVVEKKQSQFNLKKMIKLLHIKDPAEHVMAILGRKYPSDAKAFTRSGIKGTWDRDRAGTRMKLKEPETWERLLSQEGNKAKTWEKLIDNNSLPFMAMLRNLRNMIVSGISEAHHKKILSKLTNKKAVIQSRQFPIRFLSAYKVIMELRTLATSEEKPAPTLKDILAEILKKIPKSQRFKKQEEWDKTPKSRLRATLAMPLVYRLYKSQRSKLQSAGKKSYSMELLQRYREALETAVQISCRYNIPPLPGKTVVLLNSCMQDYQSAQDFCLPPESDEPETEEERKARRLKRRWGQDIPDDPLAPTFTDLGVLLSLMIGSSAEDLSLVLTGHSHWELVKLESDVLLQNVRTISQKFKAMSWIERQEADKDKETFSFPRNDEVNNIIIVTDGWVGNDIDWAIRSYKNDFNNKALIVQVLLNNPNFDYTTNTQRDTVVLTGFSEQMLRFVAERGSSRLLDHVEHLDKVYKIPPPEGAKEPLTDSTMVSIPATPQMRWKSVRVFISSTFRDMHAERDVLVRSVFPELRRRAAPHCLYLQEVELRWGVTEEEQARAAELCLREVCRSQMMVVLLGERYGLVPPKPSLPELPQYSWLSSAPEGLSLTEMEIRQFEALYPNWSERMFCYFRDPSVSKSVPVAWRADFSPESKEAESKMADLKARLREEVVEVFDNYSAEWGGVVDGKPYLKNLELFRDDVIGDLWTALKGQFIESGEESVHSEVSEQEVHQESLCGQFFGRSKLLSSAVSVVEQAQTKGGVLVLEAGPGEGKTVFMAALGQALKTTKTKPNRDGKSGQSSRTKQKSPSVVFSYSTAASQSARSVDNLLRFLVKRLRRMKTTEQMTLPASYQELLSEFHTALSEVKRSLVILVDGVDLLLDGSGLIISDWIPQHLPQGVCLVVSVPTSSSLIQTLSKRRSTVLFSLAQLSLSDRRDIVHNRLDSFGKKLSDSAFNNQVQTLIMKKGAVSPLYLHLACEDLRNFASFDKLKDSLQTLPQSLPQLVEFSLDRLCSENREIPGLRWALAALTVSSTGLKERDLYCVLSTCNDLYEPEGAPTWNEALEHSRKPKRRIPMANFTQIVHSLQSLIGSSNCAETNELLALSNPEMRRAFEDFFLPTERERCRAHLLLAAHLWSSADPMGTNSFLHCEAAPVQQLPHSLMESNQMAALEELLSSYDFMFANVRHGLLHHLLGFFSSIRSVDRQVEDCRSFLKRHSSLLSLWPALFVQQALNEPSQTSAHCWAQGMMGKGGLHAVKWLNNSHSQDMGALVSSFPSEPSCLVLSPDEQTVVVGTGRGTLHFIHTQTGQMVRSVVSSCDGISSCVFVKDGSLATTSFDGKIEMWDVDNGCRTALVNGHNNAITGSDLSSDRKHLATVSLDFMLKVWNWSKGEQVASLSSPCPMNCVTFDPEGLALAVGCWNGKVTVWNWLQNKTIASLVGHARSVHSLAFSSPSLLCSGSVSGEVRVWSVSSSSCVGSFQAHCGATEALTFIDDGNKLLSAGADHMLQLWSGGLGQSVATLQDERSETEPPQKRRRAPSADPVLSVAVTGETVAVGTRDALHLYSLDPECKGEKIWFASVSSSVTSLLWVSLENLLLDFGTFSSSDSESESQTPCEVLVLGLQSGDLQTWRTIDEEQGFLGGLSLESTLPFHKGAVLALAENHSYIASASEDCSIALWSRAELRGPPTVLRGHSGGVSCLCFSPDGDKLLSGGKDQALMFWECRSDSNPVLSKTLHHCHRDWITGCCWIEDCIVSSSNDGRLCFWDFETDKSVKEICWKSSLTSVCCQGQYVVAGGSDGGLHVWNFDSGAEICHISAHHQPINHCALVKDKKESDIEELTVATASEDGTAKIWKPLQVEHCGTFPGHTGLIRAVVMKSSGSELLSVSEDGSVRCWDWTAESPPVRKGSVTALCFGQNNLTVIAGFESGLVEFWYKNQLAGQKQVSKSGVTALCSMPDLQLAVGFPEPHVDVFKVVTTQHGTVSLQSVRSYKVSQPVKSLLFCSVLVGVTKDNNIIDVVALEEQNQWDRQITNWSMYTRFLGWVRNDDKSVWLAGEMNGDVHLAFMFSMGPKYALNSTFGHTRLEANDVRNKTEEERGDLVTAVRMDNDFVVCGDIKGNMWFSLPLELSSWSSRKPIHTDSITALRLTKNTIVSASRDKTIKIWDRATKKQLGMFVCRAPVVLLEVFPEDESKLVCGDQLGNLYFLCWSQ